MGKKLTRAGLEAALKRAGKVATSGPRSSRAGRVIPAGPPKRLPNAYVVEHVSSTAIDEVGYDSQRCELRVTFKSGRTYVYDDVPSDAHEGLVRAESRGAYFNTNIRDAYEYRELP